MAVTLTARQLAYRMRLVADTSTALEEPQLGVVTAILAAATALVVRYAPLAPDSIHNEGATRLAGFLYDTPPSGSRQWQNPMIQSGATAVLSSYRIQRATPIGGGAQPPSSGLRAHGEAEIEIDRSGIWIGTGLFKPDSPWWLYQLAADGEISAAVWQPRGALLPAAPATAAVAGAAVDTSPGYVVGCNAAGEILIAGPSATVTVRVTIWAAYL